MANSNCQAWNICSGAAPDTDRAEAGRGSDGDGARGKTAIRVASDELTSTSDDEADDNGTGAGGHRPPGAGGNLEMCDYYWS